MDPLQSNPDYANEAVPRRNALPPRSYWIPKTSLSLNGTWRFHYAQSPLESAEFEKRDLKSWDTIQVPGHWQLQGYGDPAYTSSIFPFPVLPPKVPGKNPTGTYSKRFSVPADWEKDSQIRLRFDGVDSAYHVWVNGDFVGYAQGSRNPAEFDVTGVVKRYELNTVMVRVYQWSDGSYIEAQDQWWLSGTGCTIYPIITIANVLQAYSETSTCCPFQDLAGLTTFSCEPTSIQPTTMVFSRPLPMFTAQMVVASQFSYLKSLKMELRN